MYNVYQVDPKLIDLDHAIDWCNGIVWSEIETKEEYKLTFTRYETTVNGIDIYYCYGADYYIFVEGTQ